MRDEAVVIALGCGAFAVLLAGLMIGVKLGGSDAFDNCINYYSKSTVEEARATCKQIMRGVK
jgi:hypothetical protein